MEGVQVRWWGVLRVLVCRRLVTFRSCLTQPFPTHKTLPQKKQAHDATTRRSESFSREEADDLILRFRSLGSPEVCVIDSFCAHPSGPMVCLLTSAKKKAP